MKRTKSKKNDTGEQGLDQAPRSPEDETPNYEQCGQEEDPPNRTLLAAISNLKSELTLEITRVKKDICATVDNSIKQVYDDLRGEIAATRQGLQTAIANLETTASSLDNTVKEIERAATSQSDSIDMLQQQVASLSSEVVKLNQKCEDLEGRSRRHNIRIIGVPEGKEGPRPRDYVAVMLKDVLSLDKTPLIDRVHRTLRQRPSPSEPPRPLILRLHYYHTLEDILRRAATTKNLQFQGNAIRIFPDYPPTVAKRRALFNKAREMLRNQPGVKYGLLYPARLLVTRDNVQTSFTDPKKAEEYAGRFSSMIPETSDEH